jgi:hypothetical protein
VDSNLDDVTASRAKLVPAGPEAKSNFDQHSRRIFDDLLDPPQKQNRLAPVHQPMVAGQLPGIETEREMNLAPVRRAPVAAVAGVKRWEAHGQVKFALREAIEFQFQFERTSSSPAQRINRGVDVAADAMVADELVHAVAEGGGARVEAKEWSRASGRGDRIEDAAGSE